MRKYGTSKRGKDMKTFEKQCIAQRINFFPIVRPTKTDFFSPTHKKLKFDHFQKNYAQKNPNSQIDGGEEMLLVKVGNDGFKSRVRTLMPGPIQFRDQLNFV